MKIPFLVMCAWIITLLLIVPVTSKGGGGHGGGHGGRRRRHEPSSYKRFGWNLNALPLNPFGCLDLPTVDEDVVVLVNKTMREYAHGKVERMGYDCTFRVRLDDGSFVDRGTDQILKIHMIMAIVCLIVWRSKYKVRRYKARIREFDVAFEKHLKSEDADSSKTPPSGWYSGRTSESDGTKQDVSIEIEFCVISDRIGGRGADSKDGTYKINGVHAHGTLVKWKETYQSGFDVEVRGTWNGEELDCFFLSSRDIVGDFQLVPCSKEGEKVRKLLEYTGLARRK